MTINQQKDDLVGTGLGRVVTGFTIHDYSPFYFLIIEWQCISHPDEINPTNPHG